MKFYTLPINPSVPGISILVPEKPILPNGAVNFIFQVRGIPSGDTKMAENGSLNAVVVTAEAGGSGSLENLQRYGNVEWINDTIRKVLKSLSKVNNGVEPTVGRIGLSSWSGGYGSLAKILENKLKLIAPISSVTVFDGIHDKDPNRLKPWVDFAKEAQKDPSKKFVIVHTDIKPNYTSSTESAKLISDAVGAKPDETGTINSGGFSVYRVPGNDAKAHIAARDKYKDIWAKHLAPDWNQGTFTPPTPNIKSAPELKEQKPLPQIAKNPIKPIDNKSLEMADNYLDSILKNLG